MIPDPQAVRELAYRLWEQRGRGDGLAQEDWYAAEQQLAAGDIPTLEEEVAFASAGSLGDASGGGWAATKLDEVDDMAYDRRARRR